MISILHPSRSRPERAAATARKWLDNAGCDVEYILSIDIDDPKRDQYPNTALISDNRSAIDAINHAAEKATGNILMVLSDDFDCPPLWGKQILDVTKGKTDWILKTPDGIQDWIITMPIMDRAYYERFQYIYYPAYLHMFCDTELSCVADLTGRLLHADIRFTHNHYSTGKGQKDEISDRADKTWTQGEKLFLTRFRQNFDLKETPGKITNQNYLNWIKSKL